MLLTINNICYSLCAVLTMCCTHYVLYSLCAVFTMCCTHHTVLTIPYSPYCTHRTVICIQRPHRARPTRARWFQVREKRHPAVSVRSSIPTGHTPAANLRRDEAVGAVGDGWIQRVHLRIRADREWQDLHNVRCQGRRPYGGDTTDGAFILYYCTIRCTHSPTVLH
jgi:hypothetical protein